MTLTEEQKRLAEANHNLIYFVLDKYKFSAEQFYGDAAIGLCYAAATFNSEKGYTFSTYAGTCIKNQVSKAIQRENTKGRSGGLIISLNEPVSRHSEEYVLEYTLESNYGDPFSHLAAKEIVDVVKRLPEKKQKMMLMYANGYTLDEIAAEVGSKSGHSVNTIIGGLKKQLKAKLA